MPKMVSTRCEFQVIWMTDGRIFAIGGYSLGRLNSVEMLNREWTCRGETTGEWRRCGCMLAARCDFTAVTLRDEVVLVTGGLTNDRTLHDSVELFVPPAASTIRDVGQWTTIHPPKRSPTRTCSAVFVDGVVLIFGTSCALLFTSYTILSEQNELQGDINSCMIILYPLLHFISSKRVC